MRDGHTSHWYSSYERDEVNWSRDQQERVLIYHILREETIKEELISNKPEKIAKCVSSYCPKSNWLFVVKLKGWPLDIALIVRYAKMEQAVEENVDELNDQVDEVMNKCKSANAM